MSIRRIEREEKARKSFTKPKLDYFGRSIDAAYLAEASRRYRLARMGGATATQTAAAPAQVCALCVQMRCLRSIWQHASLPCCGVRSHVQKQAPPHPAFTAMLRRILEQSYVWEIPAYVVRSR